MADHNTQGFSLIELMIALVILGIAIVPMVHSVAVSSQPNRGAEETAVLLNHTRARMEEILAMDFNNVPLGQPIPLGDPSGLTDTVTVLGEAVTREVKVQLHDGNGDGAADSDLKKITVRMKDLGLETLKAQF